MIFSIGTSNRSLSEFIEELQKRQITQLVDVRSSPYSRLGHFCAPQIERWANREGILYRQAGAILGGRSNVPVEDPRFLDALAHLIGCAERERIAIFCAEGDPLYCHRHSIIGLALLLNFGVDVQHILRDGRERNVTFSLPQTDFSRVPASLRENAIATLRIPSSLNSAPRLL